MFNRQKCIKIASGAECLSLTVVDLRISVSLGVFSRSLYLLYFLRHLGCLFLSCSPYCLAAASPPSPIERVAVRSKEEECRQTKDGAPALRMAALLRGTWVRRGAGSLKRKGKKSKLANILFRRAAVRDGDATTFAAGLMSGCRHGAVRREDKQKLRSHFSSGWVLLPCAISYDSY